VSRPHGRLSAWPRDLALGVRFAFAGGREGWARTLLTAIGVGLGVAMLLIVASVPTMLTARYERDSARDPWGGTAQEAPSSVHSLLLTTANTTFRDVHITGFLVRADGPAPVVPPGLSSLPGPGELAASPALIQLIHSEPLLRARFHYRLTQTIAPPGLSGPRELYFYAGDSALTDVASVRIDHFGSTQAGEKLDPLMVLLIVVALVVLLVPVGVFIGAAVRFGGERRDRRLAALRLVGADRGRTRRIAAGEAAFGALLGIVVGAGFFLLARQFIGSLTLWELSAFPSDVRPDGRLAALIVLGVPASAVAVALLTLRGVAIEPLGVVRDATPRRRRLLWRLAMPLLGAALLYQLSRSSHVGNTRREYQVGTGAVLLLVGLTALLPWLVESVVRRLGPAGPVSWQLACRRLQLTPAPAARMVSGITVAVAGAIAALSLFSGAAIQYGDATGQDPSQVQMQARIQLTADRTTRDVTAAFSGTEGVTRALGSTQSYLDDAAGLAKARTKYRATHDADVFENVTGYQVTVGDCGQLRRLAAITGCRPGSVYIVGGDDGGRDPRPGERFDLDSVYGIGAVPGPPRPWTLPATARPGKAEVGADGSMPTGILATPQALPPAALPDAYAQVDLGLDKHDPDAADRARNTAIRFDPRDPTMTLSAVDLPSRFTGLRRATLAGAAGTLVVIGAGLMISMLEQLRDRRKLLAVLVAFGTRRRQLVASVLWQTALPVLLGLALAVLAGLGFSALLRAIAHTQSSYDWSGIGLLTGAAATVILVVTALSIPPLWRMMRPDGLRTE
jgi:hypothetical protein